MRPAQALLWYSDDTNAGFTTAYPNAHNLNVTSICAVDLSGPGKRDKMFTINALSPVSFATDTRLKIVFLGCQQKG
jgi:hypothetical protein